MSIKATLATGFEDTVYTLSAADLLTGFTDVDGDTLSVANLKATNGMLSTYNTTTGSWTFTPTANYDGAVNLTYSIVDSKGGNLATTQSFFMTAVNDAPVNTLPTTPQSVLQGSSLVFSSSNRISVSDVDSNGAIAQVTLSASYGSLGVNNASSLLALSGNNTNILSLQGTIAGLNTALNGLRYTPNAQAVIAGSVNLIISTSDLGSTGSGGTQTDVDSLAILVNAASPLQGTTGNDTLTSSSLSNFIQAFDGDDIITGNGGHDIILAGTGNDIIRTGSGNDFIDGGLGKNTIYLSGGIDTIVLSPNGGTNNIYGHATGSTRFRLDAGLTYGSLSIAQSGTSTLIQSSGTTLALLDQTQANTLSASSFI